MRKTLPLCAPLCAISAFLIANIYWLIAAADQISVYFDSESA